MTPAAFGELVRQQREKADLGRNELALRLTRRSDLELPDSGLTADVIAQLETHGTVHVGGLVSVRLIQSLDLPLEAPSPLLAELLSNLACALEGGFMSARLAAAILAVSLDDLQEAFDANDISYAIGL